MKPSAEDINATTNNAATAPAGGSRTAKARKRATLMSTIRDVEVRDEIERKLNKVAYAFNPQRKPKPRPDLEKLKKRINRLMDFGLTVAQIHRATGLSYAGAYSLIHAGLKLTAERVQKINEKLDARMQRLEGRRR